MAVKLTDLYDIEDLALETGATVSYPNGRVFNSAGIEAKRKPKAKPAEPAAPTSMPSSEPETPSAAPVNVSEDLLRQMLALLNRPVEVRLPDMPVPQVTVQSQPTIEPKPQLVRWLFTFERNPNGTIKSIAATPEEMEDEEDDIEDMEDD